MLNKFLRRGEVTNDSNAFAPNASKELKVYPKSKDSKDFLSKALSSHYLFENLNTDELKKIVDCMRPIDSASGSHIIKEGDEGDLFFCLEQGSAVASIAEEGNVHTFSPGNCFGELALIYNMPRAATVTATSDCKLWALDLSTFRQILATNSFQAMIKRCEFLKKCSILDPLSNEMIGKLAGALENKTYNNGDMIIKQGDPGDTFYVIEEGEVRCTQVKSSGHEVDLISLRAGNYFGEMSLLLNEKRHANVFASTTVKVLTLSREKFNLLLGPVRDSLIKHMRLRILQSVPLLSKLPEKKLFQLATVMRVQSFVEGQYIIKQGDEGSRFYIINEGEVRCTRKNAQGVEEELAHLRPQEFFGERALITNETRKANVIAVSATVECLVLDRHSFQTFLTEVQEDIVVMMANRESNLIAPAAETAVPESVTDFKFEDLKVMRTLGTGTFGRVKLVQHVPSGQVCALKFMNKTEIVASHQQSNVITEKNLLFECSPCEFVLSLLQTFTSSDQLMMLMEFVQGGEMWSYIYERKDVIKRSKYGGFEMPVAKFFAANVLIALQYMHNKGIAYRDLKPENLLLDSKGFVKVIDFGFAKKFPYLKNSVMLDKTFTICGTPEYLAPEIILSKGYDKAVDYWAYGCLVYELFLARTPFQNEVQSKMFQNIINSEKKLAFPNDCQDHQHISIVKQLLAPKPSLRLGNLGGGTEDIIGHAFFGSINWEALRQKQCATPYTPYIGHVLDDSNFGHFDEEGKIPKYRGDQNIFKEF